MADNRAKIFARLKRLLKKYEPPFVAKSDFESRYELWSVKDIEIDGRKRKEVAFAALIIQSGYVGFYFMPAVTEAGRREMFHPELLALLKGKSCFHFTSLDAPMTKKVEQALKAGFQAYKKRGWV